MDTFFSVKSQVVSSCVRAIFESIGIKRLPNGSMDAMGDAGRTSVALLLLLSRCADQDEKTEAVVLYPLLATTQLPFSDKD